MERVYGKSNAVKGRPELVDGQQRRWHQLDINRIECYPRRNTFTLMRAYYALLRAGQRGNKRDDDDDIPFEDLLLLVRVEWPVVVNVVPDMPC